MTLPDIISLSKTKKENRNEIETIFSYYMNLIKSSKGLLYIGANEGQEMPMFKKYVEKIYAFEPIGYPSVWSQLLTHAGPGVSFYNYALSDKQEEALFYPNYNSNYVSSSLLKPVNHLEAFPYAHFADPITVKTMRLDDFDFSNQCDTMFMDVQGSELKVLNGLSDYSNLKLIFLEFNSTEFYQGCCIFDQLYEKLIGQGFVFMEAYHCWQDAKHFYGNGIFLKKEIADSITLSTPANKKLSDLHRQYETDKGTWHSYIDVYDELFASYRNNDINLLEIGALVCGSLKMFENYFYKGQIYGVDNWAQSDQLVVTGFSGRKYTVEQLVQDVQKNHPRIHLITCDSTNKAMVDIQVNKLDFDIIIDDGDHRYQAQFATYCNFIPYLRKNGIYIVEDVRHYTILEQQINDYNKTNGLNYTVEVRKFFKNNWDDDVLLIIK